MDIKSLPQEELENIRKKDTRKDYTPYYQALEARGNIVVDGYPEKLIIALRIHYNQLKRKIHIHRLSSKETVIYLDALDSSA